MAPTVYPNDRDDAKIVARRLLDAAGPERHDHVRTTTDGPAGVGFEVPDDVYEAVVTGQVTAARLAKGRPGTAQAPPDTTAGEVTEPVDDRDDAGGQPAAPPEATDKAADPAATSPPARQRRRPR